MPLVIADRVKETSETTGATNITLAGAATGYQTFNATIGVGNTCYYVIENPGTTEWEIGLGTLSAPTTFTRTTVLKSSNSNTVVTFSTGTKNVFVTLPANQIVNYATLTDVQTLTNKTLSTNVDYNGNLISGQYGGTGVANTGKTITIGGNLTTSGAFTTTLTSTANTSVTLPTTGTLATLAGSETFTNKTLSTNVDYNGNIVLGQYGGTGIANTGKTITIGGNLTTSGAFTTTLTSTANTSLTLPTTGTLATLAGSETFTNKTLSTNTTWNGNVVAGQYGGTGVANTGKTITIGGNLTTSGSFDTTITVTAGTSITLPIAGTLATLAGSETFTNKTFSTNTTWNGNVIAGQYGGTGVANTGRTITIGGNLTTSGSFTTTLTSTANTSITLPTTGTLATLAGTESLSNKYITTGAGNTTVAGLILTSGTNTTAVANGSIEFDNTNFYFSVAGARKVNAYTDSTLTGTWTGAVIAGQYGGTGIANTGKTITIGGNLTTSGAFTTTLTSTANTSVTLPTAGTLATLAGIESFTNKTLSTNTTWNGNVIPGQYGGTGIANTGFTLTMAGNVSHAGAFAQTFTATGTTSVTLPTAGTLATLAGIESFTNKTLSTNTTWNGNVIAGLYGGTGVANTGKTITIGGNLTTSGAFDTTLIATASTSVTLPTAGTLSTLAGSETLTNKTFSTNTTWNGNVITGQYGGTGVANTGKTITIGGNLTTSGAFTTTLTSTANTSVTLPTTGTLATLAGIESLSNKYITTGAGNTTVAGLVLTSGSNTTAVANGSIEFDNTNFYFSVAGARKVNAYTDSTLTGTWSGAVIAGQYGGTGVANTGRTITIGGNLTTSGAFTTTLTSTANTSVTLPTTGTLATLAGIESFTNKTLSTNTTWNGNVIAGLYGGTGVANTGKTITIGGNLTTSGAFDVTLTATAATSVTLPIAGTLATLAGIESFTNKTLSTNTTWNGNVIAGQYGGTGVANTGRTITIGGNLTTSGSFTTTLTSTANTTVTLPVTGTLATLAGTESLSNKYITTGAGNTTVAGLVLTSGSNTTAVANGSIEFDNTNFYFSFAGARKVNAYTDSTLTGTWAGAVIAGQYGGTGVANTGRTITIGGNFTTSGAFATTLTATGTTSVTLPTAGTLATLAGSETLTNKTLSTNVDYNGNIVTGQYGGTGIANTGKTITIGGNLTTSGAFTTTLTATANTSVTLPVTGTLATLAGSETLSNKTLSTNVDYNGNVITGQYGGTGIANTGKTITIGGNLITSGAFATTLTATGTTSITLPTTGTLATLAGSEILTNKTLSTNVDYNGNVISGQYGGTGIANTGKTITIGGNLTTSGAFTTTLTSTANTSITLPTTGTLSTLAGTESLSNKYITTGAGNTTVAGLVLTSGSNTTAVANGSIEFDNTNFYFSVAGARKVNAYLDSAMTGTWTGTVVAGQYGGTGIANTGKTITIGGNLTTSGAFTTTLTSTANTSVTLPTTGTLATLAGIESLSNKTLSDGLGFLSTLGNNFLDLTSGIGIVYGWGQNNSGTLGDGTSVNKSSPVQLITSRTNWSNVASGEQFSAGIKQDGTLWTWGLNNDGQLGDNTIVAKSSPVQTITGGTNWKQVSCGYKHTAAVKTDGTLWTWGFNGAGQLGDNTVVKKSSPIQTIAGSTNWSKVSCGVNHIGAIKTDGTLWSWGLGTHGALGDNTTVSKSSPVQTITGGNTWTEISCGYNSSAAIKTDGTLWAWGYNSTGAVGDNTIISRSSPVQITTGGTNWSKVTKTSGISGLGVESTAAIKTDGTLWTWGSNDVGQLGDNTTINKSSPVQTIIRGSWSGVFMGGKSTIAIESDGTLWAWGINTSGQLGDNTTVSKSSPVQTIAGGYKWVSAAISSTSTLAISANPSKLSLEGNLTTSGAFTTTLTSTANTSVTLPTTGTLATLTGIESFTNKTLSTNTTWNGNVIPGQYGGTGIANTGFTLTMAGNVSHAGAFARTLTATGTTSVTLPTTGTLATLAGIESFTNKTMSTNTTWNGNVIPGQYGGTGIANTGFTLTMAGNVTHSGAFARTFVATGITSVTLPTSGTLATLAGTETLSSKVVNLAAGNATTGPLRFTSGTNMTTAAAGNMEFNGTRLFFTPSTTRQTVAFLTDITGGLTIADDTTTAATRYLIFTNATTGSVSTANVSSTKLTFNPATGDFTAGGNIIANSDERLKENISTIEDALEKVNKLRGVEFDWKDTGIHSLGFIAQEVEKVLPDLVKEHDGIKSLAYGNMASLLLEAIKELSVKYNELEEKYNKLIGE